MIVLCFLRGVRPLASAVALVVFSQAAFAQVAATTQPLSASRTSDVELRPNGVLLGQTLSSQGKPLAGTIVAVRSRGQQLGTLKTDQAGRFSVRGLHGGVYELTTAQTSGFYRVWAEGTAPPNAGQAAVLVEGTTVRGQDADAFAFDGGAPSVMVQNTDANGESPSDIMASDTLPAPNTTAAGEAGPPMYDVAPISSPPPGAYYGSHGGDGPIRWLMRHPVIGIGIGAAIAIPLALDGDSAS